MTGFDRRFRGPPRLAVQLDLNADYVDMVFVDIHLWRGVRLEEDDEPESIFQNVIHGKRRWITEQFIVPIIDARQFLWWNVRFPC